MFFKNLEKLVEYCHPEKIGSHEHNRNKLKQKPMLTTKVSWILILIRRLTFLPK